MTLRRYSGVAMTSIRSSSRDVDEVVLDEVRAGADHRVAVAVEGLLERRRVVGLDAIDDLGLGGVGVDLAGGRGPGRLLVGQLLPADLEDRVGVEAVERAEGDQRVVAARGRAPSRRCRRRGCPRATSPYSSMATLAPSMRPLAGGVARPAPRTPVGAARHDLVEEGRQLGGRLELDARCHSRTCGPAARVRDCSRKAGHGLEPAGDRLEALGQRRVSRGRTAGTARRRSRRARASGAPRCAARRRRRSRAGRCGARGRARSAPPADRPAGSMRLDRREVGALGGELGEDAPRDRRRRARSSRSWIPR